MAASKALKDLEAEFSPETAEDWAFFEVVIAASSEKLQALLTYLDKPETPAQMADKFLLLRRCVRSTLATRRKDHVVV